MSNAPQCKRVDGRLLFSIQDPEIERSLVLSTAHITKSDMDLLELEDSSTVINYGYTYGQIVYVGESECADDSYLEMVKEDGFSDDFVNILQIARLMGCDYVKLDRDGLMYEDLTIHDW